jgi:hypothetical protein
MSECRRVDAWLRLFLVTADMHCVHHSIDRRYRAAPAFGHDRMTLVMDWFRDRRELWLDPMLLQPHRGEAHC